MDLIPTQHKYKLPKGLSYPVGAKEVSEGMASVPQYAQIRLFFKDRDTFWASEFKNKIKDHQVIKVIEVKYSRQHVYPRAPRDFVGEGLFEPNWTVRVYALPTEFRHDANVAIRNIAIPCCVSWMLWIGNIEGYTLHSKTFGFDLAKRTLVEI